MCVNRTFLPVTRRQFVILNVVLHILYLILDRFSSAKKKITKQKQNKILPLQRIGECDVHNDFACAYLGLRACSPQRDTRFLLYTPVFPEGVIIGRENKCNNLTSLFFGGVVFK